LGLPFVTELEGADSDANVRTFAIDCPLLRIRNAWLFLRVEKTACEVRVARHGGDIARVRFAQSRSTSECRLVESVVLASYEKAFAA
jgi:hypothetical protein